jgi:hypothetical protein
MRDISFEETPRFQRHEQEDENERLDPGAADEPLRPHAIRHPGQSDRKYGRQTVAEKDRIDEPPTLDRLAAEIGFSLRPNPKIVTSADVTPKTSDARRNTGLARIVSRRVSANEKRREVVAKRPCSMRPEFFA